MGRLKSQPVTLGMMLVFWLAISASSSSEFRFASAAGCCSAADSSIAASPGPTPDCNLTWQLVDTPYSTTIPFGFGGVATLSTNDVWAVGGDENQNPMSEHWDGANWQIIPAPNPGQYAGFDSVAAVASNDAWAAGINASANAPLLEHWNGVQWNTFPYPDPSNDAEFQGLAAISANDVWAVGRYYTSDITVGARTLTEHWNGSAWSIIPSPNTVISDDNSLWAVSASASNDVWVVGNYDDHGHNNPIKSLTEHWDGTSWSIVPAPILGDYADQLWAVSALAPNDAWAVGAYTVGSATALLALHWDGLSWQPTTVNYPGTGSNGLRGVVALAHDNVWAVGDYFTPAPHNRTLVEHWDGTSWQVVPSPNVSANLNNILHAVAAVSPSDIWAVGRILPPVPAGMPGTVALHYTTPAGCPTLTPTSTATMSPTPTFTLSPTSTASPTPSATPTASSTAVISATPMPTRTPTPSVTPLPSATITAYPTNTPTASPTDTPVATPTDCANGFVDVQGNIFYTAIHNLNCRGVINGSDASHYSPAGTATRAQFAKIVVLGFGLPLSTPATPDFTDAAPGYFAYGYIESGYHAHILSGFDAQSCAAAHAIYPCYLPNLAISRAQLTRLVVAAAGYALLTPSQPSFSDVPPANVFYTAIETAHAHGVVNGYPDGTFRPSRSIRRDEMAGIVFTAINTP